MGVFDGVDVMNASSIDAEDVIALGLELGALHRIFDTQTHRFYLLSRWFWWAQVGIYYLHTAAIWDRGGFESTQ